MKFLYEYRTRDNVRHDGEISAASRDAAFSALRAQGIKPGRLIEAPGFFNKLFGKGKRWIAIGLLGALALALAVVLLLRDETVAPDFAVSKVRRQIIGDTAIIEKGVVTGWADVFDLEGDRFLASFAIPGVPVAIRTTSEDAVRAALEECLPPGENDSLEARQIKLMLMGVKEELRDFLAAGGSIQQYGRLLVQRQEEEIAYYNRAKAEVEAASEELSREQFLERWEAINSKLRRMGIRLVALPD